MVFARGFGNQHTSMTSGSMEKTMLMLIRRIVLRADWIIRTQLPHFKSRSDVFLNPASYLDQTAQSALCICGGGI